MPQTKKVKGYVYILTNPSFREDWIKIGKSSRPVNVRSKELDNTAVPLPFEIYATMKTSFYEDVESMLHSILEGAHARIRKNREFFNVKPEDALAAFRKIAIILRDAEIYLKGEEPQGTPSPKNNQFEKTKKRGGKPAIPRENLVEAHPSDDLPKGAHYSFDGDNYYSMALFGFAFIRQLLKDNASLTFPQLEILFPKSILTGYQYCGIVATRETIDSSSHVLSAKKKAYHYGDDKYLLKASDGVEFYVSTQWMRDSFKKLISIANNQGYRVFIKTS
jgi:hypothetical protein